MYSMAHERCAAFACAAAPASGLAAVSGRALEGRCARRGEGAAGAAGATALFSFFKGKKDASRPKLTFDVGYAFLAHPRKETGEDAFFVEGNSIGVFDGVSSVSDALKVDPRLFSQTLAAITSTKVKEYGEKNVVKAAIEASQLNDQIGASTACVIGVDEHGRCFGVNLGDSGALVVRDGKKLFATKPQSHFFNCPLQLSSISYAGENSGDSLQMGQNIQLKLRPGDLILVATDGLWDNMPMEEIVARAGKITDPQLLADSISETAADNQVDRTYVSPFQIEAKRNGLQGREFAGGKEDDLTLVVAKIIDDPKAERVTLLSTLPEAVVEEEVVFANVDAKA